MKCTFCAEEIQNEAILCRFCGARKENGVWTAPAREWSGAGKPVRKGHLTIRVAAALMVVSGVWELFCLTSEVPLFGAIRSGWVAATYHLLYVAIFTTMGAGLWLARRWGLQAVLVGTLLYSLDKLCFLLDRKTMEASLSGDLKGILGDFDLVDQSSAIQLTQALQLLLVASWCGFALFVYLRRDYFRR